MVNSIYNNSQISGIKLQAANFRACDDAPDANID